MPLSRPHRRLSPRESSVHFKIKGYFRKAKGDALVLLVTFVSAALCIKPATAHTIDFNRDIRPILSEKCYYCHGPDEKHREADLRLDNSEGAATSIQSGEFLSRIHSDDPEAVMPKPSSKLSLTEAEKKLLSDWIEAGAKYDDHWAFRPLPKQIDIPKQAGLDWAKHPLDHFIAEQQTLNKLGPAPEAPPLRWLRRVTLDLTGLPPSLAQIAAFEAGLANDREAHYAKTVDGLLASPAYGEHMAAMWLDAARYADSYGYQSDKLNNQWPYRDWVVRAFNDNLSYDKFLTWQLAGDLLDRPTTEQRLATAFNRIHRLNNEGGAVFEEWRLENVADRVHTFGTAILGLTMECCRCHDHKYDPITTRDYYSLSAFFNSIDENGMYDRTEKIPSPSMLLPNSEQEVAHRKTLESLQKAQMHYDETVASAEHRFRSWTDSLAPDEKAGKSPINIPDAVFEYGFDMPWNESIAKKYSTTTLDKNKAAPLSTISVTDSRIPKLEGSEKSPERLALVLDGERGMTIYDVSTLDRWTRFTFAVTFRETKRNEKASVIAQNTRGTDAGYNGWDLMLENGYVESRMYRVWPGNAIGVRTKEPIPMNAWHQLTASYDGSSKAAGLKLYLNGRELETTVLRDEMLKQANVKVDHGGLFVIGQRFRARGLDGGQIDDARLYKRTLSPTEIAHLATGKPIEPNLDYFVSAVDEACRTAREALMKAHEAVVLAEEAMEEIPIMKELAEPWPAYVLARGEYDAPRAEENRVQREIPSKLGIPFPADAPKNRRGLAEWVLHPSHPLTGRVIVNRLWGNFFGAGIVRTPENFGLTGEQPSHPELLDWLARDFIDGGWDIKAFCKSLVLSATYRQDSAADKHKLALDAENRLLSRGPSHRLSAEQIRDLALAASGLLSDERGGPPVSPYQAGGDLWRENNGMSPPYKQSVGEALHRRSLYSVWKRTAPLPNMMAFDTNSREVCTVKRQRTNTPLQALVLLNDVQFVEAARCLAEELLLSQPNYDTTSPSARSGERGPGGEGYPVGTAETSDTLTITQAFKSFCTRSPDAREVNALVELLHDERRYYEENTDEAKKLIAMGEKPERVKDISAARRWVASKAEVELAALTTVLQAILNLDATIWSR